MAQQPQVGVRLVALDGKLVQRELQKFGKEGQAALERIQKASVPASRGLKAVDATVSEVKGNLSGMSRSIGPVGAGMMALGPAGAVAAVGIGAMVLGLTKAISSSRDAAKAIADVGDAAARAGLDVVPFQELQLVAERNRISVDTLTDGLKELSLRADEFRVTGAGSAAEAFQRLGYTADEMSAKLQNPADLLVELISRLEKLDRASQIRITDELFGGTAGERFVELIGLGSDRIREQLKDVRLLGLAFQADLVDRAKEIDVNLTAAGQVIDNKLKKALLDAAPAAQALADFIATAAAGFSTLMDLARDAEQRSTDALRAELQDLYADREEAQEQLARLSDKSDQRSEAQAGRIRKRISDLTDEALKIRDILDRRQGYSETAVFTPPAEDGPSNTGLNIESLKQAEYWKKRIVTADEARIAALKEIDRLEKAGPASGGLSAEDAARARLKAEEDYQAAVQRGTSPAARKAETQQLRDIADLLKAAQNPADALAERLAMIRGLEGTDAFKDAAGAQATQVAERARVKAMEEYLAAAEDTAAALERIRDIAENGIGLDKIAAETALAAREGKNFGKAMEGVTDNLAGGLTDVIFRTQSFSEMMMSLAQQLTRDFLNSQLRSLFSQISAGSSGGGFLSSLFSSLLGGSTTAAVRHGGGKVGGLGRTRTVPMSVFANAERRHDGGSIRPGERPIIALDEERVLTLAQQRNTAQSLMSLASMVAASTSAGNSGQAAGGMSPVVNIYNGSGQEVSTEQRSNGQGGFDLDVLIGPIDRALAVRAAEGTSKTANAIGKRYGLNRANALTG